MLKVGLTGGIASGKSVVRDRLESNGVPTLDADRVVHGLFEGPNAVTEEIEAAFGDGVVKNGTVDRRALGALVFGDEAKRRRLEAIVHPRVFEAIQRFFADASSRGEPLAVVDAALMFETGSWKNYDRIVVVYCPAAIQEKRLMAREALSDDDAERRISAQMPAEEKRDRADYVIDTSDTLNDTLRRADEVLERLRADAAGSGD